MKKSITITAMAFCMAALMGSANAQTNVSGGIFSDATWTKANSPYIVTDDVVVFPGFTLTIEPGVTVKFNDGKMLEIRQGSLIAQGTKTDSITFTSNSATPTAGKWNKIYLNDVSVNLTFSYWNIRYANGGLYGGSNYYKIQMVNSKFERNNIGFNCSIQFDLDSCIFNNNNYGVKAYYFNISTINFCSFLNNNTQGAEIRNLGSKYCLISNCIINNNNNGVHSYFGDINIRNCLFDSNISYGFHSQDAEDTIYNCKFTNNNCAIKMEGQESRIIAANEIESNNYGIYLTSFSVNSNKTYNVYCNKITNNTSYNFYNNDDEPFSIPYNYWGTTDSATIASKIYDAYDDASKGIVTFFPLDTVQCYLNGCNLKVSATVQNTTCGTCANGTATAVVNYGMAPFTYTWYTSPIQTTKTAAGLLPGVYKLCVTDANGCSACNDSIMVDSTLCSGFSITANGNSTSCPACTDGSAGVTITGGASPYSYTWYTNPMQNTSSAGNLAAGSYYVCVTDKYGCVSCDSVTIAVGCNAAFYLYPDTVIPHKYYLVNQASGNAPLSYLWNWGDGTSDSTAYPLHAYANAGYYNICLTITDASGCTDSFCTSFYLQKGTNTIVYVEVISNVITGISENDGSGNIALYPNPAKEELRVEIQSSKSKIQNSKGGRYFIYGGFGQLISAGEIKSEDIRINVSGLAKGLYLLKIENGDNVAVKRFIKE